MARLSIYQTTHLMLFTPKQLRQPHLEMTRMGYATRSSLFWKIKNMSGSLRDGDGHKREIERTSGAGY